MLIIFFQIAKEYPIVEMKRSNLVSLRDCLFPQIFPLAQLQSPKCSQGQRTETPSCDSINSWSDIHWVKNILWKKYIVTQQSSKVHWLTEVYQALNICPSGTFEK